MSFSAKIGKFERDALRKSKNTRDGVSIKLLGAVVLDNPVKTGRMRANWMTNAGSPDLSSDAEPDPSGVTAISAGTATIKRTPLERAIYVTNNVPYALQIEYGLSKQAPEGMMRKNVIRFQRLVDREVARQRRR